MSRFQFYYGSINSEPAPAILLSPHYFNSTMVQLIADIWSTKGWDYFNFNSTMVQLIVTKGKL